MLEQVKSIGFVGGGNMAEAIIKGLLEGGYPAGGIAFYEPNKPRRDEVQQNYGIVATEANEGLVACSDIIVLAVKPQVVELVVGEMTSAFSDDKLLVSILAGVTTARLEALLGGKPRVVRTMPNTPALVGAGAAALCPGKYVGENDLAIACSIFESLGSAKIVSEAQMDAVTGLSGSGPAYVYTMIEALADGGVQEGLPRDVAHALAVQTVLGAAKMVQETGAHPAQLRDQVCSPGGTTISGVRALEDGGIRAALMAAVSAAAKRSRELG